jgi:hypothetical protein
MINEENLPGSFQERSAANFSHIKGWGIDADIKNDPTYPMKNRTDEEQLGYSWERPEQQPESVELLVSNERKNLPAVFGTTLPPTGLSGAIRRFAFKYSESDYAHWLPLMLADRIGVVEGIVDDLSRGHIPNIFKEKGWGAELRYNRKNFILKAAATVAVTAAITAILLSKRKKDK